MTTYNLFPSGTTLPSDSASDGGQVTLGTEFYVTESGCTVTEYRWYCPVNGTDTSAREGGLFAFVEGGLAPVASTAYSFPTATVGQWCVKTLTTPVELVPFRKYRVGIWHPNGQYPATGAYFVSGGEGATTLTQGPVVRPNAADATEGGQGSYNYNGFLDIPANTFNGGCYFSDVTISYTPSSGTTLSPSGIASAEAFGTAVASTTLTVSPDGIASVEALGSPVVSTILTVTADGIASTGVFGTPAATGYLLATADGIASVEAFGTPAISTAYTATSTGIASAESFGTPAATGALTVSPSGIGSAEAFGTPAASVTFIASPAGIDSGETFGTPVMSGVITLSPAGIDTAEAFGTPFATGSPVTATAVGIGTLEDFGVPTANKKIKLSPTGIASAAAMGTPAASITPASVIATAVAIASLEVFGTPTASGNLGIPLGRDWAGSLPGSRYSGAFRNHRWDGSLG